MKKNEIKLKLNLVRKINLSKIQKYVSIPKLKLLSLRVLHVRNRRIIQKFLKKDPVNKIRMFKKKKSTSKRLVKYPK